MKKLDEIMELMTDEMKDFEKNLHQFKKLSDELKSRSIPITTEVLEKQLHFFFQKQEKRDALAAEALKNIDQKLKKAYILPKNLGILVGSCLLLLLMIIGYLVYKNGKNSVNFQGVENEESKDLNQYTKKIPQEKTDYEEWLQNQNSP